MLGVWGGRILMDIECKFLWTFCPLEFIFSCEFLWTFFGWNLTQTNSLDTICYHHQKVSTKGQKKPKARLAHHSFSQKTNKWIHLVCNEKQKRKQNKFVRSFFGRIYAMPICFFFYLTFRIHTKMSTRIRENVHKNSSSKNFFEKSVD